MMRSRLWPMPLGIALGVGLGWTAAAPLKVLTWGNLILWGAVTIGLGVIPGTKSDKILRLSLYGFSLGFSFMAFGYTGTATMLSRTPFFAAIGLFCAVCAVLLGAVVHLVLSGVRRS